MPENVDVELENAPPKPGRFFVDVYLKDVEDALREYEDIKCIQTPEVGEVQLWEIEPDSYGHRYVILTVARQIGRPPKLKFLKRVK
jgi:hypothetical protein